MPTATHEVELDVGAKRLWGAMKDIDVLLPKTAPQIYSSIDKIPAADGDFDVRLIKFGPIAPEGTFVKEKVLLLDHESMTITTEEIEGGHLAHGFSKWESTIKFTPIDDENTKLDATFVYEGGDEQTIGNSKQGFVAIFQAIAAYLRDHIDA